MNMLEKLTSLNVIKTLYIKHKVLNTLKTLNTYTCLKINFPAFKSLNRIYLLEIEWFRLTF